MQRAGALQVSTPTDTTIVITRTFDAPQKLVWEAMTRPDLLRRWMFCPPGWTWAACEMDVRVGGRFRWAWNGPDGNLAMTISGEHREVTPPAKIVHTERMEMGPGAGGCAAHGDGGEHPPVLTTLELDERGGKTRMKMTIACPTKEVRDAMLASGMEQGMEAGYQTLDAILSEGGTKPSTESLSIVRDLEHPPERVWRALTDPALLARWLLPAIGFRLEMGAAFKLQAPPQPGWDGIVSCRIRSIEPQARLSYTWVTGDLDTVVTFTLTPTATGTRLSVVHSGFKPDQKQALGGARYGWKVMSDKLVEMLAEQDA